MMAESKMFSEGSKPWMLVVLMIDALGLRCGTAALVIQKIE
jgi:hypothetical protein